MEQIEITVSEFNGEIQHKILESLTTEYLMTGKYTKDQMSISPKILSSLMLCGGAAGTALSAAMSTSLFVATANPATLMQIGQGVGSAVMGATGIVSQAPFIAASSTMMPVIAPVMAMQALSTVVLLQQFTKLDKKLDTIKASIDKMLARQEVTKVAELFATVHIVDEIYAQYDKTGSFSTDMLIRLALAEQTAMELSRRYVMLENSGDGDIRDNAFDSHDTYCTMLASLLELRIKYLRTCVDVQENPQFVEDSSKAFSDLLKADIILWDGLLNKSTEMKDEIKALEDKLESANPLQKMNIQKDLKRKTELHNAAIAKERAIISEFLLLIDSAKKLSDITSTQGNVPTILYWCDNNGEHCIAANEQVIATVS